MPTLIHQDEIGCVIVPNITDNFNFSVVKCKPLRSFTIQGYFLSKWVWLGALFNFKTLADGAAGIWNIFSSCGTGKERVWQITLGLLKLSPRSDTLTCDHISLAKANYKMAPSFKRQRREILLCVLKQILHFLGTSPEKYKTCAEISLQNF